jgi:hypothetical protein
MREKLNALQKVVDETAQIYHNVVHEPGTSWRDCTVRKCLKFQREVNNVWRDIPEEKTDTQLPLTLTESKELTQSA